MFSVITFSTCWNSGRDTAGEAMLREIKTELGIDLIELGHGIRLSLMPGIQKVFDSGEVRFSSLHNFCPLPVEVMMASPDCYQFSAVSSEERERAVKQTFQTIDFAARLDAPFVVLHLGQVNMAPITDHLITLAATGAYLSRKYVRLKVGAVQKLERLAPSYLQRVKDCLGRIIEHAASKNVRLALEGRRGYEEIPTERELPALLEELNSGQSVTGTISVTHKSKRTLDSLSTPNGCGRPVRAHLAAMCRTALGLRKITKRRLPAT